MRAGTVVRADLWTMRAGTAVRADLRAMRTGTVVRTDLRAMRTGTVVRADLRTMRAGTVVRADLRTMRAGTVVRADLRAMRTGTMVRADLRTMRAGTVVRADLRVVDGTSINGQTAGDTPRRQVRMVMMVRTVGTRSLGKGYGSSQERSQSDDFVHDILVFLMVDPFVRGEIGYKGSGWQRGCFPWCPYERHATAFRML